MASKVKITVIKKMSIQDLYGSKPPCQLSEDWESECPRFNVGDEFVVKEDGACPDGFCGWAFADIQRILGHILWGFNYPGIKDEGVNILCCTDGLRTVFFKLQRID